MTSSCPKTIRWILIGLFSAVCPLIHATEAPSAPPLDQVFAAAFEGDWKAIAEALGKGFQAGTKDPAGRTALMMAAYNGHTEVVEKLIEAGSDPNSSDTTGSTALMFASSGPFLETVKLLIKKGASINTVDSNEHFSALMWAAAEGQLEIVKCLLENGADPSLKDVDGDTAESFAAKAGHKEVAEFLGKYHKAETETP